VYDSIETVVEFLKGRGIVVHRPRKHTADELANFALNSKLNINTYNRDSLVSVGNTLVESTFKTPERLRNKYAVRYISMALMKAGNRVISMPQALDTYQHNEDESPIVEGGDVEIDNGHIYIGNSKQASNSLGVLWYKNAFPDWNVHEIKINYKR
jgi:N-dimethylarginine dimethylaminohydrolase